MQQSISVEERDGRIVRITLDTSALEWVRAQKVQEKVGEVQERTNRQVTFQEETRAVNQLRNAELEVLRRTEKRSGI